MPRDFVKQEDLKIGSQLRVKTADDIREYMAETRDFYADMPKDEARQCYQDAINKLLVKVKGSSQSIQGEVDVAKCVKKENGEDFEVISARLTIDAAGACEHGDVSKLDGKLFGEIEESGGELGGAKVCDDGKSLQLTRFLLRYTLSQQLPEGTYEAEGELVELKSTVSGAPCEATISNGVMSYEDGCQNFVSSTSKRETLNGKPLSSLQSVEQLIYKGVAKLTSGKAPWYEKGAMSLRISDWKGQVTFRGADQAPSFEVTSAKGERVTGKVGQSGATGLALTDGASPNDNERSPIERTRARLLQRLGSKLAR
jgi:hypothetical protein